MNEVLPNPLTVLFCCSRQCVSPNLIAFRDANSSFDTVGFLILSPWLRQLRIMTHSIRRYLGVADGPVETETVSPDDTALSMVSRVQQRVEELKRSFDLPLEEMFMDEFYCALYKKILLQGRMYVFENYICFYSNLFGWVKKKVIPLNEVIEVSKKRNYGFPNSIRISWKGKKEFFTSFLSRDDAYNLIMNAWSQAKVGSPSDTQRRLSAPSLNNSLDHDCDLQIPEPASGFVLGRLDRTRSDADRASVSRKRSTSLKHNGNSSAIDHDTESDADDDDIDAWVVQSGPVPSVPDGMSLLREGEFQVPVREFFDRIISSESVFFEEYHKARGDQRYRLTQWQRHTGLDSVVRCATFMSPVKAPGGFRVGLISPKETECNQNQRYRVYEGTTLVFETSQVMKDIPYGDNFTVETCWMIKSVPNGCHVSIHASVPFVRHVISPIRMMIESSVMREVKDSISKLFCLLSGSLVDNTSPSMSECLNEDSLWIENLEKMLKQKDVRAKLVALLQEGLGDVDQINASKDASRYGNSLPPLDSQQAHSTPPVDEAKVHWAERAASFVPSGTVNLLILVLVAVILVVQLAILLLWIYPPYRQDALAYQVSIPPDQSLLQKDFARMSRELEVLDSRLKVLVQGVKQAMEYIEATKQYEKT